ncbi:MAG TPA: GHMP kinase [Dehalococcoidia bacterium]|nr:GHMP kinase [Dehalococcoidia bacterium]
MSRAARAPLRIDLAGGWTDVPAFADAEGGAVVNVTIDKYVRGTLRDDGSVAFEHDVRVAGLGSSACEHVIAEALRNPDADLDEIAEAAYAAESAEGVLGGRQDQYAACYGGLSYMTFGAASAPGGPVRIERLEMPEAHLAALQQRLVLVDSGVDRLSGEIHQAVWSAYARKDIAVVGALLALKHAAKAMRDAIVGSDFGGIKQVMNENWYQQKRLHPSVTNERVEEVFELALRSGATAGKACGAGGGGALVFYASSAGDLSRLRQTLASAGLTIVDVAFNATGLEDLGP